ncbi:MAG: peptidylprolyl isomerase [Thermoplasmatota archaeon]
MDKSVRASLVLLAVATTLAAGCVAPASIGPAAVANAGGGMATALAAKTYPAVLFHTEAGDMLAVLYPDAAPKTVAHISDLVKRGYYDGRAFQRTVPGHVIQISDPFGTNFTEDSTKIPLEVSARYHFSAGALGIARDTDPNSGGSEIFIMDYATSHLDGNYTVFGQVIQGMDVVHALARVPAIQASPPLPLVLFDRQAIAPPRITHAELVTVTLPGAQAASLPLDVATDVRHGDVRHSLEWPADLQSNRSANFTWYLRHFNNTASNDPSTLSLTVHGGARTWSPGLRPDPMYPDIEAFTWTPPAPGVYTMTLCNNSAPMATLNVTVPS